MIFIEGCGSHGDDFMFKIEQHNEHKKFCIQVNRFGERAEWFGWCEDIETCKKWLDSKIKA